MERFDRRLHVRVGEADIERARALSGALGVTTSALVRLLLQLPAEDVADCRHVVLDLACANRLYRELNQWGYQQNQATHALNRIAYHLRREAMDAADVLCFGSIRTASWRSSPRWRGSLGSCARGRASSPFPCARWPSRACSSC